jgi:hypothetical protein
MVLTKAQTAARTMEQKAVVARPSQLRTIGAPATPPSNQIEATLFASCRLESNGETL